MKQSKYFIPLLKETPKDVTAISHQLMIKSGLVKSVLAGVYSYLPLGWQVFQKIENIIREEMNKIGIEFHLPSLTPLEIWNKSGRLKHFEDVAYKIEKEDLLLAPTHEELFTMICKDHLNSYKQFPQIWYQIQKKFRHEKRCKSGVIRSREFTMKDSYSFDTSEKGLNLSYEKHKEAYKNIFARCGLKFHIIQADNGIMGGSGSEEFVAEASCGEDTIVLNNQEVKVVELGHIFKLGTKYSEAFDASFLDENGKKNNLLMGSYGIGLDRIIATYIEQNHDEHGIIWNKNITPFDYHLICTDNKDSELNTESEKIYNELISYGFKVLYDDREKRAGEKFMNADLIGIPIQIIIGKKFKENSTFELKFRATNAKLEIPIDISLLFVLNNLKETNE